MSRLSGQPFSSARTEYRIDQPVLLTDLFGLLTPTSRPPAIILDLPVVPHSRRGHPGKEA